MAALSFKCEVLWALLDAVQQHAVRQRTVPQRAGHDGPRERV